MTVREGGSYIVEDGELVRTSPELEEATAESMALKRKVLEPLADVTGVSATDLLAKDDEPPTKPVDVRNPEEQQSAEEAAASRAAKPKKG